MGSPQIQADGPLDQGREGLVRSAAPRESNTLCPLATMPRQRPNIGSRMNREVHVRFWERPRDFHPRALPEPYVNLSIHTAPDVRPLPWHSGQWAKSVGFARRSRSNQCLAPLVQWTIRLYLRRAHRMT